MQQEQGGCSGLFRCGKATTWEGGVRVPAFIYWQGRIQPWKSDELFSALDIVPSFMNMIGHPIGENNMDDLHGIDQSKAIFHQEKVNRL